MMQELPIQHLSLLPEKFGTLNENPSGIELPVQAVHLWQAELEIEDELQRTLWDLLNGAERQRALRLRSNMDRKRFVCFHGLFRLILGRYLDIEPGRISFSFNRFGKPYFTSAGQLEFRIAHSGDLALFAFTTAGRIGVDVERLVALDDMDDLEKWFMSDDERKLNASLPSFERVETFYRFWTIKEAYLKMQGQGLTDTLKTINVVPAGCGKEQDWPVKVFSPMSGYLAALATETTLENIVRLKCNSSDFVN